MSDLISRSEALQRLIQETVDSKNNLIHINTVKRLLQDVDTAYDIDKVVEELKKRSKEYNSGVRLHGKPEEMCTDEAIEIVKQGGVSDDVCEWECKYINDKYVYSTSCDNIFIYETNSMYCPYCGKKIKVVE